MATGETEFGGTGGLIAKQTIANGDQDSQQQLWEVYATNAGAPEGSAEADPSQQAALGRVGKKPPRETYTPHWGNGDI